MSDETTRPAASSEGRSDLIDLVRARIEELGISTRALAAASIDPEPELQTEDERKKGDHPWARSTLQTFLDGGKKKHPTPSELRALSVGLRMPLRELQDAAAAQYFDRDPVYTPDGRVRSMIYHFEELTDEDQVKILQIMESWKKA